MIATGQKPGGQRHKPDTHLLPAFGLACVIRSRRRLPSRRRRVSGGGAALRRNFGARKCKPWQARRLCGSAIVGSCRRHRHTALCVVVCRCGRRGPCRPGIINRLGARFGKRQIGPA